MRTRSGGNMTTVIDLDDEDLNELVSNPLSSYPERYHTSRSPPSSSLTPSPSIQPSHSAQGDEILQDIVGGVIVSAAERHALDVLHQLCALEYVYMELFSGMDGLPDPPARATKKIVYERHELMINPKTGEKAARTDDKEDLVQMVKAITNSQRGLPDNMIPDRLLRRLERHFLAVLHNDNIVLGISSAVPDQVGLLVSPFAMQRVSLKGVAFCLFSFPRRINDVEADGFNDDLTFEHVYKGKERLLIGLGIARVINHSCRANVEWPFDTALNFQTGIKSIGEMSVRVKERRALQAGEEMFGFYGDNFAREDCKCDYSGYHTVPPHGPSEGDPNRNGTDGAQRVWNQPRARARSWSRSRSRYRREDSTLLSSVRMVDQSPTPSEFRAPSWSATEILSPNVPPSSLCQLRPKRTRDRRRTHEEDKGRKERGNEASTKTGRRNRKRRRARELPESSDDEDRNDGEWEMVDKHGSGSEVEFLGVNVSPDRQQRPHSVSRHQSHTGDEFQDNEDDGDDTIVHTRRTRASHAAREREREREYEIKNVPPSSKRRKTSSTPTGDTGLSGEADTNHSFLDLKKLLRASHEKIGTLESGARKAQAAMEVMRGDLAVLQAEAREMRVAMERQAKMQQELVNTLKGWQGKMTTSDAGLGDSAEAQDDDAGKASQHEGSQQGEEARAVAEAGTGCRTQ